VFLGSSLLVSLVEDVQATEVRLTNRTSVVTFPFTAVALRGWSVPAGFLDEVAFYRTESGEANTDAEVLTAVRRGWLAFMHSRIVLSSTPYLRSGVLWDAHRRAWGQDDLDTLVWCAASALIIAKGGHANPQRTVQPTPGPHTIMGRRFTSTQR
jgi:hypothetical protein